ncbi:isochorismatase family protein [Microbacterium sp. SD291]|uniref:isochorismatase family protein n=1 Tax=Microbacterium sp. SD291 TaxID=2782007 RepID=UPI001A97503B|nr:isochorismatase family protein [Microbacterium sp. SD291]MBO0981698.1 isochorismatase family protein [Microbacterium sp. SD291]
MTAPRRALIVIDPQQEYFTGLLPIQHPPRDESVQRIAAAIDAAEAAGIPIVMVQHSAGEDAPVFNSNAPGFALHPSLEGRASSTWKRVTKSYSSVFPGTDIEEWLRAEGLDTITLAGYMTNNCVLATAVEAESRGIAVEVLSDATGAIDITNEAGSVSAETVHTTLLALLHSNFAAVASTEAWSRAVASDEALAKSNLVESAAAGAAAFA